MDRKLEVHDATRMSKQKGSSLRFAPREDFRVRELVGNVVWSTEAGASLSTCCNDLRKL